jgi:F0F1-type ATP synthase assembly protein I
MAQMVQDPPTNTEDASMMTLIRGVIGDLETLVKQQLKLFHTELKAEGKEMRDGTISMALSFGVIVIGGVILGIALAYVLVEALSLPHWAGFGIIGLAVTGIGAGLFFYGQKEIKSALPLADESMKTLEENIECLTQPKNCQNPSR